MILKDHEKNFDGVAVSRLHMEMIAQYYEWEDEWNFPHISLRSQWFQFIFLERALKMQFEDEFRLTSEDDQVQ